MPGSWNRFLASRWKGKESPASPHQSRDLLGNQATVSLRLHWLFKALEGTIFLSLLVLSHEVEVIGHLVWKLSRACMMWCLKCIYAFSSSIRARQQTSNGYIWITWLHSQWGAFPCTDYTTCWCFCLPTISFYFIKPHSVLIWPLTFQPPPKLPGVFSSEFQDFVNKWYVVIQNTLCTVQKTQITFIWFLMPPSGRKMTF